MVPEAQFDPTGYVDPRDGTQHVTFVGTDSHVHELSWDGRWHHTDLSVAAGAPLVADDRAWGYAHPDGTRHVVYGVAGDEIHELWWDGAWHFNNLRVAAGVRFEARPYRVGKPYVHPGDKTQHVPYIGPGGEVHELWWLGGWHHNNLTVAAGAPVPAQAGTHVSGYVHPMNGSQHLFFRGADNKVHELWWLGGWRHFNVSDAAGAPTPSGNFAAFVHPGNGTQHVVYQENDLGSPGHLHELWWDGAWHFNDLTIASGAGEYAGTVHGYVHPGDGTQHVVYEKKSSICELFWWNGQWHFSNLTAASGAPSAEILGAPFGYVHPGDQTQHIVYRARDRWAGAGEIFHIYELWWDGQWHVNDLHLAAA